MEKRKRGQSFSIEGQINKDFTMPQGYDFIRRPTDRPTDRDGTRNEGIISHGYR